MERFGHELAPYAVNIMTALVQQFWHVIQDGEEATAAGVENDEEDFDGSGPLAGYTLLSAMETVLEAISSVPHLYPQMEELLFPILERFTSQDGLDVFEEASYLLSETQWANHSYLAAFFFFFFFFSSIHHTITLHTVL